MTALLASIGRAVAGPVLGYLLAALAAAGLVGAFALWIHGLESRAAQIPVLSAQLDQAGDVNRQNLKAMADLQADRDRQAQIATAARKSAAQTASRITAIERSVTDAKLSDDAPLSRVLAAAIAGLRDLAAAPTRTDAGGAAAD